MIHVAALVKFVGEYEEFRKVNVLGTEEVINFVEKFDLILNYISTASIAGSLYEEHDLVLTENDFNIGQNYVSTHYIRTKFEAENLILKKIKSGLKGSIFRVSNLTGRYSDGHFQININENDFYTKIKLAIELGVIPAEYMLGNYEFTPVDYCSKAIIEISKTKEAVGRIFHLMNPKFVLLPVILETVETLGKSIEVLKDMDTYFDHIRELGKDPAMLEVIMGQVHFKRYAAVREYMVRVDATITNKYLRKIGFEWPEIDQDYLAKVFRHMDSVGYVNILG
ncbi:MAG: SDR family oxidoreductase [Halanaerobiales bacterium]|nr:SDR family oxidoreductase [Halanaerobiales bacterium]